MTIHYVTTGEVARLTKEKIRQLVPNIANYMNYIAGPPGMVKNTLEILLSLGIKKEDIKLDNLMGINTINEFIFVAP